MKSKILTDFRICISVPSRLISKSMTSQPGKQTIAIHIFSNISSRKGNQTMKFGHLIECKTRNNFFEKTYIKCGGETIPRPFSKKPKLRISLGRYSNVLYSFFCCMLS